MTRRHGIDANTYQKLVIDSGAVYAGFTSVASPGVLLGATRGGNVFSIETEYRDMEVDGARGGVIGSRRITGVVAMITANFIEISKNLLLKALPGSSSAGWPVGSVTHDELTRALALGVGDFESNIVIIGEVTRYAQPAIIGISNAMCDGNLEINMVDKDESVIAVQFKAHYAPTALDAEPWFIRFPQTTTAAP